MEGLGFFEIAKPLDDPISSKIDDIHRISQVIKSVRWKPQAQTANSSAQNGASSSSVDFSACSCGDDDCIEVCDIREWLPTTKLDDELWTLVLSLGEVYLALGKCYADDDQFHQALQIVELAWTLVYGSMLRNTQPGDDIEVGSSPNLTSACFLSTYVFLARAWTLVGDTYSHFNTKKGQEKKLPIIKLKMLKGDIQRQSWDEGSLCYLMNCCCLVDRADSGTYASTSGRSTTVPRNKKGHERSGRDGDMGGNSEPGTTKTRPRTGDIFKFLSGLPSNGEDSEYTLSAALLCYQEAKNTLGECPDGSSKLVSLMKKTGWAFNELGRTRLLNKDLEKAETAFHDAITSFRQVSDHTTITRIYCNMGYARQSLAKKMVPTEPESKNTDFHEGIIQAVETAKNDYQESLKHYVAAKMEVAAIVDGDEAEESATKCLRIGVCTQLAHVYLRLGMLLAREDTEAKVDTNSFLTNKMLGKKGSGKHQVSAKDVIGEAISLFESLGELRKEEAAHGYNELAKCHMDSCLKLMGSAKSVKKPSKKRLHHISLAQGNWKKSVEVYRADSHPMMHLRLLIDMADFSLSMSDQLRSNKVLDEAFDLLVDTFSILIEARHISVEELTHDKEMKNEDAFICDKFWSMLQLVSKNMLFLVSKSPSSILQQILSRHPSKNAHMLKDLYRMTLKSSEFVQLCDIHRLWIS